MLLCESKNRRSAERSGGRRRRGAQTAHVGRLPRSGFFRGRRRASRSVPAGFTVPSCGCAHRSDGLFAQRQLFRRGHTDRPRLKTHRSRAERSRVHVRLDCGRGGRRAPPRAAPGQHSKNTAPLWLPVFRRLAGAGRGARPGRRRRPGALRRVACGGGSPGGGSRRAPVRPRRIFRRAGHRV